MRITYLYPLTVNYRCGHKETIQEGGSRSQRTQIAHTLGMDMCPACRRVLGGEEEIFIDGMNFVLNAITIGSDKQIVWAVKIRKRMVNILLKQRQPGENPLLWMRYLFSAKWWIEHRNANPADLFAEFKKAA